MPKSVFFDTQIVTRVSDGLIAATDWNRLIAEVNQRYQYRVSMNTLLELLNALGGGDENNFEHNRRRILTAADVQGSEFLPLPGQFLRSHVLGLPLDRLDFAPSVIKNEWIPLIRKAKTKRELSTGVALGKFEGFVNLGLVRKQIEDGQRLWVQELQGAKDGAKAMPSKSLYAEFILHFDVRADSTPETVAALQRALDAAYCHLAEIHHQATRSTYRFERNYQDWMDNQQLMYLGDPDCTFITGDKRLISKLRKSSQLAQVRSFDDFAANP